MKKQIRIQLKHGNARVDEDCSQATIDMLNKMTEIAYNAAPKQEKISSSPLLSDEICHYCKRTEPCAGGYPEGCFHSKGK